MTENARNADTVAVDQVWEKFDGTAPVRIRRVWNSDYFCGGGTFVRCHPLHGGKHWVATTDEFVKRYALRHNDGSVCDPECRDPQSQCFCDPAQSDGSMCD